MTFSIYTTCYLLNKNGFSFLSHLKNFSQFAAEVVVGTLVEGNTDGTKDILEKYVKDNGLNNVKIVESADISFSSNLFDGQLKNFALQNTTGDLCLQIDLDEEIPLWQKDRWADYGQKLLGSHYDALLVPTIDLWGNKDRIKKNSPIGYKFRIHKPNCHIGVNNGAKLDNGLIDTSKSDTCEVLNWKGEIVSAISSCPPECLLPENSSRLNNYIFTVHYGGLNLNSKADLAKNWWNKCWADRSGREDNCELSSIKLASEETIEHHLLIK